MALIRVRSITIPRPAFWQRGAAYFGMSGSAECIAAAALFTLMIVFRIANMLHYRFDADESQHLHVIWGWAHGFVQYRDVFDNHMPLFHLALAPIVALIGERATILFWMRFILLPMYCIAAWCTYRIRPVKYCEIIADRLSKAGWSWGCVSAIDSTGRTHSTKVLYVD